MDLEYPRLYNTAEQSTIEVHVSPFKIGRGLNCDYVITNQVISRVHCQLEKTDNKWFLRDTSTNGTYVNRQLIKSQLSSQLKDSDVIELSQDFNYKFIFQCASVDDISDEQLCLVADSVLNNIEAVHNDVDLPSTSRVSIISVPDASVLESNLEQESLSCSPITAQPNKKIKVSNLKSTVIDLTLETSQNADPSVSSSNRQSVIDLSDSFQVVQSPTSQLKMVIQKVPNTKDIGKIEVNKASSSSTSKIMGQSESHQDKDRTDEEMDSELTCAICSEMFVKASTLNCSHTFCAYCINMWKSKQSVCPICRGNITAQVPSLVLDNVIEKIVQTSSKEVQQHRKELLEERKKLTPAKPTKNNRRQAAPTREVEVVRGDESDSSSSLTETDDSDLEDGMTEYWNDDWYDRDNQPYYGGYGRCYNCGRRGHWSNGCPYR